MIISLFGIIAGVYLLREKENILKICGTLILFGNILGLAKIIALSRTFMLISLVGYLISGLALLIISVYIFLNPKKISGHPKIKGSFLLIIGLIIVSLFYLPLAHQPSISLKADCLDTHDSFATILIHVELPEKINPENVTVKLNNNTISCMENPKLAKRGYIQCQPSGKKGKNIIELITPQGSKEKVIKCN